MPSFMANMYNLIFRLMPPGDGDFEAERKRNDRRPPKPPKGVRVTEMTLGTLPAERIEKEGNDKGWVLYIHGGGFTTGSARERRGITQYIVDRYGYNCLAINYRLAPENRWPTQLEDCLQAYRLLPTMNISEKDVVLMGESAGGTLVLSLPLALKERDIAMPRAIAAFSPCVNQAEHYPSHSANAKTDYMLRDAVAKGMGEPVFGKDAPVEVLRSPLASPIYGDFSGLPPVFLSASDTEALLDDSRVMYEKLKAAGHRAELDIQHGCCHAFQMVPMIPEARTSLEKAFRFLEDC